MERVKGIEPTSRISPNVARLLFYGSASWLVEFGFHGWGCQLELGRVVERDLQAFLPVGTVAAVIAQATGNANCVSGQGLAEILAESSQHLGIRRHRHPDEYGVGIGPRQLDVGGVTRGHQPNFLDAAL